MLGYDCIMKGVFKLEKQLYEAAATTLNYTITKLHELLERFNELPGADLDRSDEYCDGFNEADERAYEELSKFIANLENELIGINEHIKNL